ncbi:proline-rich receptor-like protein kinase PERK9 [Iris pallida]|uniref:Proline-rich receptor-like protein kinase PERK9 n=1 Tax=Iris pallida TaxID=29817 RepID=A0AAX6HJH5_IRIPA|nr:proline-rich receptor-like protein kinase PERK9 [Iris pallida]
MRRASLCSSHPLRSAAPERTVAAAFGHRPLRAASSLVCRDPAAVECPSSPPSSRNRASVVGILPATPSSSLSTSLLFLPFSLIIFSLSLIRENTVKVLWFFYCFYYYYIY